MLCSAFFGTIVGPSAQPRQLGSFLSAILKEAIGVLGMLPGRSTEVTTRDSLLMVSVIMRFRSKDVTGIRIRGVKCLFPKRHDTYCSTSVLLERCGEMEERLKGGFRCQSVGGMCAVILFRGDGDIFGDFSGSVCVRQFRRRDSSKVRLGLLRRCAFVYLSVFSGVVRGRNEGVSNELRR